MITKRPGFNQVSQIQERALRDQLAVARQLITHPAEKGRSLENEVSAVIRELLPSEYGVGSGFIVFHGVKGPELSPQLDIILYDSVRMGPLARLAACEVYPIEAVYGYVEVKASLRLACGTTDKLPPNSIERCLEQNHVLRQIRARYFWDVSFSDSPIRTDLVIAENWLPLRGFVFAFEAEGAASDPARFAQSMAEGAKRYDAHLHGVLVLDQIYLTTIPVDVRVANLDDYYHVSYTTDHPFAAFRLHLLKALGTFQRPHAGLIPASETYFELPDSWKRSRPLAEKKESE